MSDIGSLIFYVASFSLSVYFYYLYCKLNKKIFLFISFIIPVVIGGFRYNIGTDYPVYENMFQNESFSSIGMNAIVGLSKLFNGGFPMMFFVYNFLTLLFIYMGLGKIEKNKRAMVLFCYFFLFFTTSFNTIRQGLAIAIIFFAYKFVDLNNNKKWLLSVMFASMFHITALICLPFCFIVNCKSKYLKYILVFIVLIVAIFYQNILDIIKLIPIFSHYEMYVDDYSGAINNRMFYIDLLLLAYFYLFKRSHKTDSFKNYRALFVVGLLLEIVGFTSPFVKRIADYFLISKIVLLPDMPYMAKGKNRQLNYLLIRVFVMLIFFVSVFILRSSGVIPYIALWEI